MRRLWVRWALLIAFVAALGTAFVNLGGWQLDRYNDVSHLVATGAPVTAHPGEPDAAR